MLRRRLMKSDGDFVNLGLPSGLLWAKGNIVKNGDKYEIGEETAYGAYVSWGNIVPHFSSNGSSFDDGYDWGDDNSGPYAETPGATIEFIEAGEGFAEDSGYDAARELLGGECKMPTKDDFVELYNNCTWAWVENYNGSSVKGQLFTSKINGARLFFPAAGRGENTYISHLSIYGYYWSRSLYDAERGYYLSFMHRGVYPQSMWYRYCGCSVRAVK